MTGMKEGILQIPKKDGMSDGYASYGSKDGIWKFSELSGDSKKQAARNKSRFGDNSMMKDTPKNFRKTFVAIWVAIKKALKIPDGTSKLKTCACRDTMHIFLFSCPTFRGLSLEDKNVLVNAIGVCKSCLINHSKDACTFKNSHG